MLKGHTRSLECAQLLPDGRILSWSPSIWSFDNTLRLWDGDNGKQLAVLEEHTCRVAGVQLLPDGRIVSDSLDSTCIRVPSGQVEYRFSRIECNLTVANSKPVHLNCNSIFESQVMFPHQPLEGGPVCWADDGQNSRGQCWTHSGQLVALTASGRLVWLQLYKGAKPLAA